MGPFQDTYGVLALVAAKRWIVEDDEDLWEKESFGNPREMILEKVQQEASPLS
jgi:hypothetical protein